MRFSLILFLLSFIPMVKAQDQEFSDPKIAAPFLNPSLFGKTYGMEFTSMNRYVYPEKSYLYNSSYLIGNYGFEKQKMWLGFTGELHPYVQKSNRKNLNLVFSKLVQFNKKTSLRFGIAAGITSIKYYYCDCYCYYNELLTENQFDASAGFNLNINKFSLGYGLKHIQSPFMEKMNKRSFDQLTHSLTFGFDFSKTLLNKTFHTQPFLFLTDIGMGTRFRLGLAFEWNGINLQGSFNIESTSIGAGYLFKKRFGLRYNYTNLLLSDYYSIHDIGITLRFLQKENTPEFYDKSGAF